MGTVGEVNQSRAARRAQPPATTKSVLFGAFELSRTSRFPSSLLFITDPSFSEDFLFLYFPKLILR